MDSNTIFFSYSRKDAETFAFKLANDLRVAGADVWIDQLDIAPGKNWDEEIEKALNESKYVLFIASEMSVSSQNVLNEIYYAVDENKTVIPIRIHDCAIPFRIRRFQYIDFTGDYDTAFNRLVKYLELQVRNQASQQKQEEIAKPALETNEQVPLRNKVHEEGNPKSLQEAVEEKRPRKKNRVVLAIVSVAIAALIVFVIVKAGDSSDKLASEPDSADSTMLVDSTQQPSNDTVWIDSNKDSVAVTNNVPNDGSSVAEDNNPAPAADPELESRRPEVEARYPGTTRAAWTTYVNETMNYPEQARQDNIEGTVIVRFVVDEEGNVNEVTAVGGPMGGGLRREAVRIVKSSGQWVPAVHNGQKVRSYKRIGVPFKLDR